MAKEGKGELDQMDYTLITGIIEGRWLNGKHFRSGSLHNTE